MSNAVKTIIKALQDPMVSMVKVEEMLHQAVMTDTHKDHVKSLDSAVE